MSLLTWFLRIRSFTYKAQLKRKEIAIEERNKGEINWSYIEHLHGNFFSIIHIHHNFQRDNFELLFDETPLREYKTIHRESIDIVKNWVVSHINRLMKITITLLTQTSFANGLCLRIKK
jgi:hypothetical protein